MAGITVTYLSAYSDEAHELFMGLGCPTCGRPLVEEPTLGGTMFRCRRVGQEGEQPEEGAEPLPTHWIFAYDRS